MDYQALTAEGYRQALAVLRENSTPLGFTASPEKIENYFSVWARDHAICAIAASESGEEDLIATAVRGVLNLLKKQVEHGQVPSYIEVESKKSIYGGLGSVTSVDSNMWIAIAAAVLYKKTKDKRLISSMQMVRYRRFYRLFKAFDSNDCGLLEVPKAGDWADIFNRTYHVLYDECLYYESLRALLYLFKQGLPLVKDSEQKKKIKKRISWISKRKGNIKQRINSVFWFTPDNIDWILNEYMIFDDIKRKEYGFYQSHLEPFKIYWQNRIDVLGNLIAIIAGVADEAKREKIISHILRNKINRPVPVQALYPVVHRHHKDWEPIYRYREQPYTYHNGGIWPFIGGFWIYVLARYGKQDLAKAELYELAYALWQHNWNFNEYFHGKTGKPMGKTKQAWSAAGYVIAYQAVDHKYNIFNF